MHGVGGTLRRAVPSASSPTARYGAGWNVTTEGTAADAGKGVTGHLRTTSSLGLGQLGAQAIGVLVIWTVIFGIAFAFFKIQNAVMKGGIRPPAEMEIDGMDMPEMGALAYPEFEFAIEHVGPGDRRARRSSARPGAASHQGEPPT